MIKLANTSPVDFFEKSFKKAAISEERATLLQKIAVAIAAEYQSNGFVNLNFICTHNSRRSQLGQVWAHVAAEYFNLNVASYSGGTETTAFHRNTVKTLQKVGFTFKVKEFSHQNPVYSISYKGSKSQITGFSKIYDDAENPSEYIAITTCNSADQNCPFIPEASHRFHLPFVDPKHSDNSDIMDETYLKTSKQIASEVYFLFGEVKKMLA
ncbi:MAG: hypothetical protein CMB99_07650 [Flavobacteriaceae bacterium]|nr:hypothetical protein [Flavobacteriaceae bacterium]|tara:strand:+ start:70948 stop:71580 length:633 start_codon:yes stop_codon:yes gene_type:complete